MDEILYLEPDEEVTGVIDKLKKTESDSVGLVIPRNSTLVHSIVNLKLLKKEAQALEKEIALVTTDKIGKNIASQVGLQVFEDVHAKRPVNPIGMPELPKGDDVIEVNMAGDEDEEMPKTASKSAKKDSDSGLKIRHYSLSGAAGAANDSDKADAVETDANQAVSKKAVELMVDDEPIMGGEEEPPARRNTEESTRHKAYHKEESVSRFRSSHRSARRLPKGVIIALAIVLVLAVATLLGLPQTTVVVTVAAEPYEKNIPITVKADAKAVDTEAKIVPGQKLDVSNDDARRVVATGKKDVGAKAKGTVTISNSWQTTPWRLAAGTVFTATDGKAFSLVEDVSVPGATVGLREGQLVTNPGTTTATLEASESGESYNIGPTRFTIGGLTAAQQEKFYAESTKAFAGGNTRTVSIMTQSDVDTAKDALVEDLKKAAIEQLQKDASGKKLINESIIHEVVSVETSPSKVDSETEYFDIKVKAKHQAMVFDEKQVQSVVDEAVKKETPSDKELLLDDTSEFVVAVLGKDYKAGTLELESQIKAKIGNRVDTATLKKDLKGRSEAAARERLASVPNIKEVAVQTFPRWWWQDISFMAWNTHIDVNYE